MSVYTVIKLKAVDIPRQVVGGLGTMHVHYTCQVGINFSDIRHLQNDESAKVDVDMYNRYHNVYGVLMNT